MQCGMDLDGFRSFILDSGIDVWTWIDMAISVASTDHENELKERRDGIIQKLYTPALSKCQNCDHHLHQKTENEAYEQKQDSAYDCGVQGWQSGGIEEEEDEDEEKRKILEIRVLLDDQTQSERSLIDLLQILADMDTSFKALKETEIGRHVTKLRKHSSGEVRRLVKILVRKWKDTVDEWVRLNTPPEESTECIDDKKSPGNPVSCYSTQSIRGKGRHNNLQAESEKQVSGEKHLHVRSNREFQHAKKQRSAVQMPDFHSNNGGSVPIKYW